MKTCPIVQVSEARKRKNRRLKQAKEEVRECPFLSVLIFVKCNLEIWTKTLANFGVQLISKFPNPGYPFL